MRLQSWPLALLGLVVLLLLGRGLVEGPAEEKEQAARPEMPFLAVQLPQAQEEPLPVSERKTAEKGETGYAVIAFRMPVLCTCDRNGMPLTGRTWRKTVYLVCPPEGVPG